MSTTVGGIGGQLELEPGPQAGRVKVVVGWHGGGEAPGSVDVQNVSAEDLHKAIDASDGRERKSVSLSPEAWRSLKGLLQMAFAGEVVEPTPSGKQVLTDAYQEICTQLK